MQIKIILRGQHFIKHQDTNKKLTNFAKLMHEQAEIHSLISTEVKPKKIRPTQKNVKPRNMSGMLLLQQSVD